MRGEDDEVGYLVGYRVGYRHLRQREGAEGWFGVKFVIFCMGCVAAVSLIYTRTTQNDMCQFT